MDTVDDRCPLAPRYENTVNHLHSEQSLLPMLAV